jgi:hypothetical protein
MFQTTNQKEFAHAKKYQPQESFDKSGMVKCSSRMGRDPLEHPRNRERMSQPCSQKPFPNLINSNKTQYLGMTLASEKIQISSFSVENIRDGTGMIPSINPY